MNDYPGYTFAALNFLYNSPLPMSLAQFDPLLQRADEDES